MQDSIKSTFRDYVRIIFQRKKFILVPVLGITSCFAIYVFCIAEELYVASNSIAVLDNKTHKPIIENLTTTSDLGKRVSRSVKRVTSRSGISDIIASIDYLASKFPNSDSVQSRRLRVLTEKQAILQFRMSEISKKLSSLSDSLTEEANPYQRRTITSHMRSMISTRNALETQREMLEEKIHRAREIVRRIARIDEKFDKLAATFRTDMSNEEVREEYEGQKSQRDTVEKTLDLFIDKFEKNLVIRFVDNSVTASFESTDPQMCKDVVDETLFRIEFENVYLKREEILNTEEILNEKIKEYQQRVADKEMELKRYERLHLLNVSPQSMAPDTYRDELAKAGTIIATATPVPTILGRYRELDEQLLETQQNLDKLKAERDSIIGQIESIPEFIENAIIENEPPRISAMKNRLSQIEMERAKLLETKTEKHPHVVAVNRQINALKQSLREVSSLEISRVERTRNPLHSDLASRLSRLETEISGEKQREKSIAQMLEYYHEEAKELPDIVRRHIRLVSEFNSDTAKLQDLQDRKAGAEITRALEIESRRGTRFEKRDPTRAPGIPHKPNRKVLVLLGLILGIAAGAVTLFFVEYADRSIRGTNDIKRHLGLPIFGTIPFFFKHNKSIHIRKGITPWSILALTGTVTIAVALVVVFIFDSKAGNIINRALGRTSKCESRMPHEVFPRENYTSLGPTGQTSSENVPAANRNPKPALEIIPGVFASDEITFAPGRKNNTGNGNNHAQR